MNRAEAMTYSQLAPLVSSHGLPRSSYGRVSFTLTASIKPAVLNPHPHPEGRHSGALNVKSRSRLSSGIFIGELPKSR